MAGSAPRPSALLVALAALLLRLSAAVRTDMMLSDDAFGEGGGRAVRAGAGASSGAGREVCSVAEEHKRFRPYYDRWTLLASLSQRLLFERAGKVLRLFHAAVEELASTDVVESSNTEFAQALGKTLQKAVEAAGFEKAQVTEAEVKDFKNLGLIRFSHLGSAEQQASLLALETELCEDMKEFIQQAQAVEAWSPLYTQAEELWKGWQQAWGPVRVFVKVTTQCRVLVPANRMMSEFFQREHQDDWQQCGGVDPWAEGQFPSAVMACSRADGEHITGPSGMPLLDRDHMVRYLGCGANRVRRRDGSTVEPPVGRGVSEACSSQTREAKDFANSMCGAGSVTSDSCRYYGPFWSIFSAPLEHIYGRAVSGPEGQCPLSDDPRQDCGKQPQLEAYKAMVNLANAEYVYGSLPPLVASKSLLWKEGKPADQRVGWEQQMDYPLPASRRFDPPMWEALREAEFGNSIIMISYGYSGSGKTTTLCGDATAPVGGARGLDGVISIYLRDNAERIKDVRIRFVEIYGRVNAGNGRLMEETGLGLWGFRLKTKGVDYLGSWSAFAGDDGKTIDFDKLNAKLNSDLYTLSVREVVPESLSGAMDWGSVMKEMLTHIEILRSDTKEFDLGPNAPPPLAHIRATPNNPKSSRGTLVVSMDIDFTSGETGNVAALDVAGAEDPAVLVEGFMTFRPAESAPCIPPSKWSPDASKKLIQRYISQLNNESFLDGFLGECLKFRDFLVPCDRKKPRPECVDVKLESGRQEFVRPDVMAEEAYVYKTHRTERDQLDFVFKYDNFEVVFKETEVMEAMAKGAVKGQAKLMTKTAPSGKKKCGGAQDESCPGSWVQRLWGRCGVNEKGACVRIGEIDGFLFRRKMSEKDYDFMVKGKNLQGGDRALQGIPKDVVKLAGVDAKDRGKLFRSDKPNDPPARWKAARLKFWRDVHQYFIDYAAKEVRLQENWETHLKYFVSAINPMVEEGIIINEALNQMRSYLGAWATESRTAKPGEPLNLWPVRSLREEGKTFQVIDDAPGSSWSEQSYDLYTFIKGRDEGESYAERSGAGQDQIMMLTMLEQLRLPAAKRGKEAKVLFGAYIRTDQPGADPNCDGARVSLNFAQGLSESVGWNRAEGLLHFA